MLSRQGQQKVSDLFGCTGLLVARKALLGQAVFAVVCLTIGALRSYAAVAEVALGNPSRSTPAEQPQYLDRK